MPRPPTRREPTFTERDTRGYVYVITNKVWPDYVKVGCAGDCNKRLSQFNTGSPHRDYEMVHHVYSENRRKAESRVHELLINARALGEWFKTSLTDVIDAMSEVDEFDPKRFTSEETA